MHINNKHSRARWLPVAATLALTPALATAETGTSAQPGPAQPPAESTGVRPLPSRSAETTIVNTRFSQAAGEGCQYETHITGVVAREPLTLGQVPGFSPSLRVNARVRCGADESAIRERVIDQHGLSADELLGVVDHAAGVVALRPRGERALACTFEPRFVLDGRGALAGTSVSEECESSVGGGPGAGAGASVVRVRERFARDLTNGCEYRATVHGTLRALPRGERYSPDLRIRPEVHCADQAAAYGPTRRIQGAARSLDRIERDLDDAGTFGVARAQGACEYNPDFRWGGATLRGESVSYACRGANGSVKTGGVYVPPVATDGSEGDAE